MSLRDTTSVRQSVRAALRSRDRVVLAISGGLDSMVLLDAAAATVPRSRLIIATFDHGTGTAATAAWDLAQRSAAALDVEFVGGHASTTLETEAEFREERWQFLRGVAGRLDAAIATAHSCDDQVETVLMRVLRDAGARGLAGLFAESDLVRPLLKLSRRDLARYARAQGLIWVEDPSNATPRYLRNRVRHDLLPALRHVRLSLDADLLGLARKAARWRAEVEAYVAAEVEMRMLPEYRGLDVCVGSLTLRSIDELRILWPAIAARAGLVLDRRGIVRLADFTREGRVGSRVQLAGGWEVTRSRDALQFRASNAERPVQETLALSNDTRWGDWSFYPRTAGDAGSDVPEPELSFNDWDAFDTDGADDTVVRVGADGWSAWLPTDRPLFIRIWEAGDAMAGSDGAAPRKVKHFLSEAGVTGHERTIWPVVVAGDQIVWIPGVRRSDTATARSGRPGLAFICEYANR